MTPTPDLSDDEKHRIVLEERYRAELRDTLSVPTSPRQKRNAFLNSNFGIWLLSAIFLSGSGTVYGCWQKNRDETRLKAEKQREEDRVRLENALEQERVTKEAVERLDTEISYRISQALLRLSSVSERGAALGPSDMSQRKLVIASGSMSVLQSLTLQPAPGQPPLYPEYANYALPTLLSELERRVPERDRREIEQGLAKLLGAGNSIAFRGDNPAEEAAAMLLRDIVLPRWKRTAFHYVDCSSTKPFC